MSNRTPITPVEATNISRSSQLKYSATICGRAGVTQPSLARACVRAARIDDDCAMGLEPQMLARNQHGRGLYEVFAKTAAATAGRSEKIIARSSPAFFKPHRAVPARKPFGAVTESRSEVFLSPISFLKRSSRSLINRRPVFAFPFLFFQIACHPYAAIQLIESFDLAPTLIRHRLADQALIVRFRNSGVQNRITPVSIATTKSNWRSINHGEHGGHGELGVFAALTYLFVASSLTIGMFT